MATRLTGICLVAIASFCLVVARRGVGLSRVAAAEQAAKTPKKAAPAALRAADEPRKTRTRDQLWDQWKAEMETYRAVSNGGNTFQIEAARRKVKRFVDGVKEAYGPRVEWRFEVHKVTRDGVEVYNLRRRRLKAGGEAQLGVYFEHAEHWNGTLRIGHQIALQDALQLRRGQKITVRGTISKLAVSYDRKGTATGIDSFLRMHTLDVYLEEVMCGRGPEFEYTPWFKTKLRSGGVLPTLNLNRDPERVDSYPPRVIRDYWVDLDAARLVDPPNALGQAAKDPAAEKTRRAKLQVWAKKAGIDLVVHVRERGRCRFTFVDTYARFGKWNAAPQTFKLLDETDPDKKRKDRNTSEPILGRTRFKFVGFGLKVYLPSGWMFETANGTRGILRFKAFKGPVSLEVTQERTLEYEAFAGYELTVGRIVKRAVKTGT